MKTVSHDQFICNDCKQIRHEKFIIKIEIKKNIKNVKTNKIIEDGILVNICVGCLVERFRLSLLIEPMWGL